MEEEEYSVEDGKQEGGGVMMDLPLVCLIKITGLDREGGGGFIFFPNLIRLMINLMFGCVLQLVHLKACSNGLNRKK